MTTFSSNSDTNFGPDYILSTHKKTPFYFTMTIEVVRLFISLTVGL